MPFAEDTGGFILESFLPFGYQIRMYLVTAGDFSDGLLPFERFQGYFSLEGWTVLFADSFHSLLLFFAYSKSSFPP
jgi:hypothetical protein